MRCLELWLPNQGAPGAILPPYPARVNCVKLLMEVEEMEVRGRGGDGGEVRGR